MAKLKMAIPKEVLSLPEEDRRGIMSVLAQALKLPKTMSSTTVGGDEHNMWTRNGDDLLAGAEDDLYEALINPWETAFVRLFSALDLPTEGIDLEKAFTDEFHTYNEPLQKSKNARKPTIKEMIEVSKRKRDAFLKYIADGDTWTKKQMKRIDDILKSNLPNYAKIAEEYAVRAGFLAKVRNKADRELFETTGAFIDRYPESLKASEKKGVVLTLRQQQDAEKRGEKVTILPLTPLELRSVRHAEQTSADKMTEVNQRQMSAIRQIVMRAKQERWSVQKLAQTLFDLYGDQNRDWRRVAITELSMATNNAYLAGCSEGDTVVGMGAENACKHCKTFVIGKSFTVTHQLPKENYTYDMKYVWSGKSNYGRRTAEFVPCVPMHPNCRCRWHKMSRFYSVDSEGKFVRKTTAELIQEERARRGLPPDPNLK